MTSHQVVMLIAIAIYLLFMIGVGIMFAKRNNTSDDFYLGGRRLGPLVTAMSAEASDMSSYLLMGVPGLAYLCGIAEAGWTAIGLAVGTYLNWLIVAKRIRRYSLVADNSITIPEFFSKRFHDKRNILTCVAAIVIIIFFIPYTASGFAACGKLFNSLFGVDYMTAVVFSAIVIVGYTVLGGFLAASTTDLVQSCLMTAALIVVLCFGVSAAGGLDVVVENAKALPGYLDMTAGYDAVSQSAGTYGFIAVVSTLAWGLGYFGMPHILLRFMAIKDEKKLTLSRRIASIWVVISLFIAIFIGVVGLAMSAENVLPVLEGSSSETVIVQIASLIAQHGWFAAVVGGLIIAGILAATMSTADSQLLAASSSLSQNLLRDFFGIKMSGKTMMLLARLTVVGIAVLALFLAKNPDSSVFRIVSFAWAGFGAAFGPVVLFSLFWRRMNMSGALAGMLVGGIAIFVWKFQIRPLGGAWDIYELLPAFILASLAIVIVSLVTKAPSKEITDDFDRVAAMK